MKKTGILALAMVLGFTASYGQEKSNKHEIRIGVSDGSVVGLGAGLGSAMTEGLINEIFNPGKTTSSQKDSPLFQVGYRYQIDSRFTVGVDGAYQNVKTFVEEKATGKRSSEGKYNFIMVLPTAEFSYFKKGMYNLYGSASAGVNFVNRSNAENGSNDKKFSANFVAQVNPIGIKVGHKFGGFAELGFGAKGIATGGLFYKF